MIEESDEVSSPYEHLRQQQYLYVRVVAGKDLLIGRDAAVEADRVLIMERTDLVEKDAAPSYVESDQIVVQGTDLVEKEDVHNDPYVEVQVWLGDNKGTTTRYFKNHQNPEWNQVFAISRDKIKADMLEVAVKAGKEDEMKDDFMGWVLYDLCIVPKRVPPESPVAPQWYRLEDRKGVKLKGELMLAVWWGTKADEAFSDAASVGVYDVLASMGSKVYDLPTLWYVTVNLIEAQDLIPSDKKLSPEIFVEATLGNQNLRTRISNSINPIWNEELRFVAAEPFNDHLMLSVEDRVSPVKHEVLGRCVIPLQYVDRRIDNRAISFRWFNLEREVIIEGEKRKEVKFDSRIHMRICLEGGYHVLDESADYISDLRPTAKQLWKNTIGVLELRILSAGLLPMKTRNGRETADAYCVAKYGKKWIRTRTLSDTLTPKWNEQYTWEVFDPCTVITIGVFDNCHLQGAGEGTRDSRMGKVRIRLSTLDTDRVYTHSYPLWVLHPSGLKKMGEIHLAVRFTCSSILNLMHMYSQPLLPKMHYIHPLTVGQRDSLRHHATQIVSTRLSRAEPPLRKEIVEYMQDVGSHMWSMRRANADFFRIMSVLGTTFAFRMGFDQIYDWNHPIDAVSIYILVFMLVLYPALVPPSVFLYLFIIGIWNYRWRPRSPLGLDARLSRADNAHPDELDEEFDTFPTSCPPDIIRMRYDRLRSISGKIQTVVGDLATQGEKLQSLLSWRDPRATALFVIFCLIAAIVLYTIPFYVIIIQTVLSVSNHPWFNKKLPSVPINFFRRLPARTDCML